MSKLFVTVLGTGNYFDCYYCKGDQAVRTPFIQDALIKFLYLDQNLDFDMKILLTDEAKNKNYKKLEEKLKEHNIKSKLVKIPEGKNHDELWDIFDNVSKTIDDSAKELLKKYEKIISKCYELNDILFKYNIDTKPTKEFEVKDIKNINKLWDIFNNANDRIKYIRNELQNVLVLYKDIDNSLLDLIIYKNKDGFLNTLNTISESIDTNSYKLLIELQEIIYKYNELEIILSEYKCSIIPEFHKTIKKFKKIKFTRIFNTFSSTIINKLKELLSLNVTIDITHSLRNIPMQIVVAMNYLTLFNDINLEGIYYGAFELGEIKIDKEILSDKTKIIKLKEKKNLYFKIKDLADKNILDQTSANSILKELKQDDIDMNILNQLEEATSLEDLDEDTTKTVLENSRAYTGCTITYAPICNLNTYYDLLKWTNAINSFMKCGNTLEIKNIIDEKNLLISSAQNKTLFEDDILKAEDLDLIEDVVTSLDNFTNCINTCRGMYSLSDDNKQPNEENSIKYAADILYDHLQNLDENISIKPLKKLFELIKEEIKPFVNKSNLEIGIATIDWCIKYNLYQQGYTALEESLKTLLCVKLKLQNEKGTEIDETDIINREDIANVILNCAIYNEETGNYEPKPEKEITFSKKAKEKDKEKAIKYLNILYKNKEFYKFVKSVKDYRNDINHFGFSSNGASKYEILSDKLLGLRDKLIDYSKGEFPWMEIEEIEN